MNMDLRLDIEGYPLLQQQLNLFHPTFVRLFHRGRLPGFSGEKISQLRERGTHGELLAVVGNNM